MLPIWHQRPVSQRERAQRVHQDGRSNSPSVTKERGAVSATVSAACFSLQPGLCSTFCFALKRWSTHVQQPASFLGFVPSIHFIILLVWPEKQTNLPCFYSVWFNTSLPSLPEEVDMNTHTKQESDDWSLRWKGLTGVDSFPFSIPAQFVQWNWSGSVNM